VERSSGALRRGRAWLARRATVSGSVIGQTIDIDRIICPLRYDIRIRIDFLRLLRDEWQMHEDDFDTFRQQPEARAYFAWFKGVRCARYHPEALGDPAGLESLFGERVRQTARLWQSVVKDGFDTAKPIRLGSGLLISTVNGKVIQGRFFAGDGCHRIACLYLTGVRRLEPNHYQVAFRPRFVPLDNTAMLIDAKALDVRDYLAFISQFYCDGEELATVDLIREYVLRHKPQMSGELDTVLEYDLRSIAT